MSYNSKQLKVQSSAKKLPKPKDVDYISKMGYRDDSPFRDNPYNDIYTPNGIIDMSQTGISLFANGQYLPPYSGMHDMGTENVREIPVAKKGGQKGLKKFTSKNIQTSLNDIMQRNTTLFGSSGKKRYKPDLNYKYGGWLDQYQPGGTFSWAPSGPIGEVVDVKSAPMTHASIAQHDMQEEARVIKEAKERQARKDKITYDQSVGEHGKILGTLSYAAKKGDDWANSTEPGGGYETAGKALEFAAMSAMPLFEGVGLLKKPITTAAKWAFNNAVKSVPKQLPGSPNVDFSKYLTQEEAVAARAERLISQKNKPGWNEQLTPELEQRLSNAVKNHNPASDYAGESLGANTMGRTATEVSRHPMNADKLNPNSRTYDPNAVPIYLNDANKARVAAHETGHYYSNSFAEGEEWLSHFNLNKLVYKTRTYLRGKNRSANYANEIRERAGQLKDYIAQKNNIPLNQDFKITQAQLDDAIENYVKDTGLDNTMSKMLGALKDKKGLLKTMNKYALGTVPAVVGVTGALQQKKQGGQKSGWLDQYQGGGPIKYETILGDDGKPMLNIQPEVEIIDNKYKSPLLIGTKGSFINSNGSDNVWDKVKQQWVAPPKYPGLQPQLTESKSKIPTRVEEIPSKRIIAPLTEIHKPIAESTGVPIRNAATINKKLDAAEMSKLAPFIAAEKRNQEATAVARYRNEQARANGTATGLYDEANEVRKYLYQQDKKKADEDRTAVMMAGLALAPAALYIAGVPAVSTALAVGSTMHGINAIPNTYSNWVAAANPNNETTWEDALGTTALNALDFWGTGQAFKQGNRVYNKGLNKFIESNSFVNQLKEPPISVYDRLLELKNVKPKVQPLTQFQKEQTVLKTENDFDNWFDENQNNMIYEQFAKSAHHDVNNANIYIDRALRNKYGPTHTLSSLDDKINRNPEFRLEGLTKAYNAIRAQSNNFENWLTTSQRLKRDLREALNRPQTSFNWDKEKQLEISNLNEIKDVDKQSIDKVKKYMERPVEFTGTQGYSTKAILGPVHKIKNISSIPKTEDILDLIESFEKVYKKVKGQKTPIEQSLRIQLEDLTGTYWLRTTAKKELQDLGLNPKDLSVIDNGTGGSKNLVDPEGNIVGTVNLYNEESNFIHSTGVNHKFHGYKKLKSKNDKKNAEEKLIERLAKDKAIEEATTSHYNRHDPYNPHFEFSQGIYDELMSPTYFYLQKTEAEKKLMQLIDNNQNFYGDMLYRSVHHAINPTRGPLSSNANFINTTLPDPITNENIEAMRGALHWGKGINRGTYEQGPDGILRVIKKLGGEKWLNHNRSSKFVNSQNSNWLNKYQ